MGGKSLGPAGTPRKWRPGPRGALAGQGGPGDGPPGMNAPASSSGEAPRAPPQRQALTRPPTGLSRLGAVAGMGLVCPRVRTRSAGPRDLAKRATAARLAPRRGAGRGPGLGAAAPRWTPCKLANVAADAMAKMAMPGPSPPPRLAPMHPSALARARAGSVFWRRPALRHTSDRPLARRKRASSLRTAAATEPK